MKTHNELRARATRGYSHWRGWLALAGWLLVFAWARPAAAQGGTDEWVAIELDHFVILCPPLLEADVRAFANNHGAELEAAYGQLAQLYGTSPLLPVNIRVYANEFQFRSLNALVPPLTAGTHTHLGSREIALVQPFPPGFLDSPAGINALRHELNGLFLSEISGGGLPPGLEAGINQYVEVPGEQTEEARRRLSVTLYRGTYGPLLPWAELFESTAVYEDDLVAYPQALSVAAFLVDSYGFGTLAELARAIGAGQSYRSALAEVYARPMDELERDWLAYLPTYIADRYQYNALHRYDLSPFYEAVEAGAYTQAAESLEQIIPFLEATGQAGAVAQARDLATVAQQGIAAGELLAAEQDAFQSGDYERALALAQEAQAAYGALSNTRRVHELQDHITRLGDLLALRATLAEAQAAAQAGRTAVAEAQLLALLPQFEAAGDLEGRQMAVAALEALHTQRVDAVTTRQTAARVVLAMAALVAAIVAAHAGLLAWRSRGQREPAIL